MKSQRFQILLNHLLQYETNIKNLTSQESLENEIKKENIEKEILKRAIQGRISKNGNSNEQSYTEQYFSNQNIENDENNDQIHVKMRRRTLRLSEKHDSSSIQIPRDEKKEPRPESFNISRMKKWLRGSLPEDFIEEYLHMLMDPIMQKDYLNLTKEESRNLLTLQVKHVLESGFFKITEQKTNPTRMLTSWSMFGWQNFAIQVKLFVHLYLYGGAVYNLGTSRHKKMIPGIENFTEPGSFCMTELEHGSNVRMLQTTAVYDRETEEFIIHTPNEGAVKWWIGNLQKDAINAAVFARLIHDGVDHGVHAFIVPIRNPKTMEAYEGVYIGDCGDKVGLNSIDNGFVAFDHVRIPRKNLLNKFGNVKKDGSYVNEYGDQRFTSMLGELIGGRTAIVISAITFRRIATTIAIRFALNRKQFGPKEEVSIINYPTHQIRIMPILASCYIYEFAKRFIIEKYRIVHDENIESTEKDLASLHGYASGFKAIFSWDTIRHLQTLRECCGGQGYSSYNRFGELKDDNDVKATFEGDNTVLAQQFATFLIKKHKKNASSRLNTIHNELLDLRHDFRNEIYQLLIFEYRMLQLITYVSSNMDRMSKTIGYFNALQNMGPQVMKLARSGVEYFSLKRYIKYSRMEQAQNLPVLKLIQDVFILDCISRDPIGFLEVVDKNQMLEVELLFSDYCKKLTPYASDLVDAFNIPDFIIRAPLGRKDKDYVRETVNECILRNLDNLSFNPIDYPLFSYTEKDIAEAKKKILNHTSIELTD